ncbi:Hint domain-containing protein [Pseudooceanicola aestuarii]|uniref:Hint domain-containing protein n=1 Tax=Pseudooceanicola aestuarii TaxID=2697319 RepID=UPI0013D1196E|nr:Hint domain-containing protein [Pseudooceanicola aestuarii]
MTIPSIALRKGGRLNTTQRLTSPLPIATRSYFVSYMAKSGVTERAQVTGPVHSAFENACGGFARGTLIATPNGPVAIEDLRPGMQVNTVEHGPMMVSWLGSMTMLPNARAADPVQSRMTRITSERFGPARPFPDLVAGPGARILNRPEALRGAGGQGAIFSPARDFVDGDSVISVKPQSPIEVYHLMTERHATVIAGGLEVETFHPGYGLTELMGPNLLKAFMRLFPHLETPADFGVLSHPRMTRKAVRTLYED